MPYHVRSGRSGRLGAALVGDLADDGSHDRPTGQRAENWGRRDKIRAGAVSGPWRSAPREDAPLEMDAPRAPRPTPPGGPPLAWTGRQAEAPESPVEPESTAHTAPRQPRGRSRRSVLLGVLAGAGIAAAIVAVAIYLRPQAVGTPLNEPPAPTTPAEESGGAITAPAGEYSPDPSEAVASAIPAEGPAGPALRLRVGPDVDPAREAEILAELSSGAGPGGVLVERLPFRIAASRVGYYHEADYAAAVALADRLSPLIDDPAGALAVRDYGELLPDAEPGRLDLWVADPPGDG